MPRISQDERVHIIDRDATICRPCGNYLSSAKFFPVGAGWIRICGECQASEKRRDLGMSGNPDEPNGVECYGIIKHAKDGERNGHWTC